MASDDAALRADELLEDTRWIHAIARNLLTDASTAEDVVQEAWVAALARPSTPTDATGSTRSWLARVVRNLAEKRWRSDARRRSREASYARGEALPSTADLVARAEMQRLVVEAVLALQEPYRTAVMLAHVEGLSSVEIARSQGISDNTVRWRIQRGLALLRFELDRKRGREWLAGCALLLSSADRVAVASAAQAAVGAFALATPKAALGATLTLLMIAGGATFVVQEGGPASAVAGRVVSISPADEDVARATQRSGGVDPASESVSPDALERPSTAFVTGPAAYTSERTYAPVLAVPGGIAIGESVRSTLEGALGAGATTDAILATIGDALATSVAEASAQGGPRKPVVTATVLPFDVGRIGLPAVFVIDTRATLGRKADAPR